MACENRCGADVQRSLQTFVAKFFLIGKNSCLSSVLCEQVLSQICGLNVPFSPPFLVAHSQNINVEELLGHSASAEGNIRTRAFSQEPKGASGEISTLSGLQPALAIDTFLL